MGCLGVVVSYKRKKLKKLNCVQKIMEGNEKMDDTNHMLFY